MKISHLAGEMFEEMETCDFSKASMNAALSDLQLKVRQLGTNAPDFGLFALYRDLCEHLGLEEEANFIPDEVRLALPIAPRQTVGLQAKGARAVHISEAIQRIESTPIRRRAISARKTKSKQDETKVVGVKRVSSLALPFTWSVGDGKTLLVWLRGAIERDQTLLPSLGGLRVGTALNVPTLSFSDPTLDLDARMKIGWYVGTNEIKLEDHISEIISTFATTLNVSKIVVAGNSGGGFAAIRVGSLLRTHPTTVVAFNPQTNLARYEKRAFRRLANACFDCGLGELSNHQRSRTLALPALLNASRETEFYYVQNLGDTAHVNRHQKPFKREVESRFTEPRVNFMELDGGRGHRVFSFDTTKRILERFTT